MINLSVQRPTDLWLSLGKTALDKKSRKSIIDLDMRTRLISCQNRLEIREWDPQKWTGEGLFHTVGYERTVSNKMTRLINTYIDQPSWSELKKEFLVSKRKAYSSLGMNFKMKPRGKGGCLSSFHLITVNRKLTVIVTSKIAEVPKKFLADLKLVNWMLNQLGLGKVPVVFNISIIFFSMITMRTKLGMSERTNITFIFLS